MLHEVVLTLEPVEEILKCDYSYESLSNVLSFGVIDYIA